MLRKFNIDALGGFQFQIRVAHALGARLEAVARRENNRLSAVTRRLLTQALDALDAEERQSARSVTPKETV